MALPGSAKPPTVTQRIEKPQRPNYGLIHARPLPIQIHPLPPLVLHNPLSIAYFAYTYISQLIIRPSSHPYPIYTAYFSSDTRSVHVADEVNARALWECGFFGKGNLSRSEPSWLDREKRRKGIIVGMTSEEVTRKRREERKEFKAERARKEREAIQEKLRLENEGGDKRLMSEVSTNADSINEDPGSQQQTSEANGELTSALETHERHSSGTGFTKRSEPSLLQPSADSFSAEAATIQNQEHLQLTLTEAFFLSYGLGCLDVADPTTHLSVPTVQLLTLFRQHSYFPPSSSENLRPDDPFLISYVVYHHFRSFGWVVREGIKFGVDYLLYLRGPAFSHAEFAISILPSYTHPHWHETEERATETKKRERKSWWWVHCVNRVQSQVKKSLILVYVEIPPPEEAGGAEVVDIGALLKSYKVREIAVRRWIPNRSRD